MTQCMCQDGGMSLYATLRGRIAALDNCRSAGDKLFLEQMAQQRKALEAQIASMKRHIHDVAAVSSLTLSGAPASALRPSQSGEPLPPPRQAVDAGAVLWERTDRAHAPPAPLGSGAAPEAATPALTAAASDAPLAHQQGGAPSEQPGQAPPAPPEQPQPGTPPSNDASDAARSADGLAVRILTNRGFLAVPSSHSSHFFFPALLRRSRHQPTL